VDGPLRLPGGEWPRPALWDAINRVPTLFDFRSIVYNDSISENMRFLEIKGDIDNETGRRLGAAGCEWPP